MLRLPVCLSQDTNHPVVVVDCSTAAGVEAASQLLRGNLDGVLPGAAENSLHSNGNSLGIAHDSLLVSALADGTLVLDNIHKVSSRAAVQHQAFAGCVRGWEGWGSDVL